MTDNDKCCPPPKDVQDFQFKEESVTQICDEFPNVPVASSLIAADEKRGLLYIGHETKFIVLYPGTDVNPPWKLEIDLPYRACRVELNCDCSLLAVIFNQPLAVIYDASSISKHKLNKIHEIRLSSTAGEVFVSDFKWNPAIPDMFCSVTSDHIIGSFQVSKEKGVHVIGREKPMNLEALCVSWSPKGKQIVVGCKNGDIVQLKPELKIARHLNGPNPSEGFIISILWISNYQFCVCFFHADQQRINVMIVDAPKGVTVPKLINYEDVTFGGGPTDGLCYYFEHIPEWGIIIAASTHSSELAVLGTEDNGATWNIWQLMEGSTVQLPLNRKKKTENYPVGLAIDKSPTQRLPWGTDSTLPNPVPILRILVTSGQMCCYHMANLKENAPVICLPPTEIISAPALPRPSLGPSEVSFNLPSGATSTPQKQNLAASQIDKTKVASNMFSNLAGSNFSFSTLGSTGASEPAAQTQMKGFAPSTEIKMTGLFGQGDGKSNLFQQNTATISKPFEIQQTQPIQQIKSSMPSIQQPYIQPQTQSIGFSAKPTNKIDPKPVSTATFTQVESKILKEPVKEIPQTQADELKSPTKAAPVYDEGICLQAFHEEQARFEKELKIKLELPTWDCGSEDERQFLVKKTDEIDAFFKELQETTNSLASDVAYLKALLLQSFAWIEETKSKSSANTSFGGRNRSEGSKLAELQRLFDYTQTQLTQATKVLDLEWAEYNNREMSKMKIPSLEIIYQSLIKHTQIITQQKKIMEELTKKWRSIARGGNNLSGVADLDRSMASLNLSQLSNTTVNNAAIDLRCKLIASNTRNFTKEKQIKLRDLLMVTEPKIVPAMKPTAVQERLQATLSSLASLKATEASIKAKPSKAAVERQQVQKPQTMGSPVDQMRAKPSNPILSLDNLVSGLGTQSGLSKSPSSIAPFSTMSTKPNFTSPQKGWAKDNASFAPSVPSLQASTANKTFSFSSPVQKPTESQGVLKENSVNAAFDDGSTKFPSFAGGTFAKQPDPPGTIPAASTGAATTPMFNFTASNQGFAGLSNPDNGGTFKFSTKTTTPNINFAGLSTTTTPPTTGFTSSPSFSFGKATVSPPQQQQQSKVQQQQQQQTSNFGRPVSASNSPTTAASQAAATAGLTGQFSFGKTTTNAAAAAAAPAASISPEKSIVATSPQATISSTAVAPAIATTTASSSIFGTGSTTLFGSLSITPLPSSPISAATGQATATTTTVTSVTTKVSSPSTISSTASSLPSFAGLLGATASLSFGTTPNTTVSSTVPTFGNVFAGNAATTTKADAAAVSNNASSPFQGSAISTATSMFGATNTTTSSGNSSIFGGQSASTAGGNSFFSTKAPATTTAASSTSVFGGVSTSTSSIFGGGTSTAAPAFASNATTQPSNVFGTSATTQSSGTSIFGATATTQSSVFGAASTTPSTAGSIFGAGGTQSTASSIFGTNATQAGSGSVFGASSGTTTASGTSIFGATAAQSTSVFGAATTTASPVFGATTAAAAATTTTTTTNAAASSIFGGSSSATPSSSPFGASSSSAFGTSAASTGSIFGAASAAATTASSLFGAPAAAAATTTPSMFGSPVATTAAGGSIFCAASPQPAAGVFGSPSPAGAGSVFGAPPAVGGGTSMFGGAASSSMFGQSSAFGVKPVFGTATPGFGSPAGTSGFGSPPAFGTSPGFGSPPAFGAATAPANTSPSKVFGSNTFETLGAQSGGLSFGSLAQGTPQQQQEQKPTFQGSSSFSSWR